MSGAGLLVWGGGGARSARAARARGAVVVAWPGADTEALAAERVGFRRAEDVLGENGLAEVEAAGRRFARVWARLPLAEGRSFRELASWRGQSLLWASEGFLSTASAGARCARSVELCLRLLEALDPGELDASGLAGHEALLLARSATVRGVLFHGETGAPRPLAVDAGAALPGGLRGLFGLFAGGRRRAPAAPSGGLAERSLLLVLLSRPADEPGLVPLLEAVRADLWLQPLVLPTTALASVETRSVRGEVARAARELRARCTALQGSAALAASYVHRGVPFADLARGDLEALLCRRLPRVVQQLERALELLEDTRPALLLLGVEERDERRALGLAALAAGVPWVLLRSTAHEPEGPERADGGPQPAATLAVGPGAEHAAALRGLREAARARVGAP
ncbi:MAG: hypothetical protein ACM3PV_05260 [Betaproteobacteria bacterium]